MILLDAHVHIRTGFGLAAFLDAAWSNFDATTAAFKLGRDSARVLMLTESKGDMALAGLAVAHSPPAGAWSFAPSVEPESLWAVAGPSRRLCLIAGRQVVSADGLEVLALATRQTFEDRAWPLAELVRRVSEAGALAVVPWGAGKWTGRRGALLAAQIGAWSANDVFLGDSGSRPAFAAEPKPFAAARKRGIRVLPGTDPLPLPWECRRPGSYGAIIEADMAGDRPAASLRRILRDPDTRIRPYGARPGLLRFLLNQFALRLRKRG